MLKPIGTKTELVKSVWKIYLIHTPQYANASIVNVICMSQAWPGRAHPNKNRCGRKAGPDVTLETRALQIVGPMQVSMHSARRSLGDVGRSLESDLYQYRDQATSNLQRVTTRAHAPDSNQSTKPFRARKC